MQLNKKKTKNTIKKKYVPIKSIQKTKNKKKKNKKGGLILKKFIY